MKNVKEIYIDLDADPFVPNGWKVEEHRKGGQFKWDASQVTLYLSKGQHGGKAIEGNKLRKEIADKPVFNANVLDYLLANPDLIPEEWKGKYVFFWGTVYRDSGSDLDVRYLYWGGDRWRWFRSWLDGGWRGSSPAAVPASSLPSDFGSSTLSLETLDLRLKQLEALVNPKLL